MSQTVSPLIRLLVLLEDEFRDLPGVRVRVQSPSSIRRSPDLEQDYDPEASSIHRVSGVKVQTRRKEYFFQEDWILESSHRQIFNQVEQIREELMQDVQGRE